MNKLMLFLFMGMFMVSFASAAEIDNIWSYDKEADTITFENRWGIDWIGGGVVAKAKLIDNGCIDGRDCSAIKNITLEEEMELIEDFRTFRIDDGSWVQEDIISHKLEYLVNVDNYVNSCTTIGTHQNGTSIRDCNKIVSGYTQQWVEFSEGQVFPKGYYLVKTSGKIIKGRGYDWQVRINGDWTTPWATWGNISLGDDAEVTLNSPADNATAFTQLVTFNASANITGGDTVINMSLYTNETGSWAARNTTFVDPINDTETSSERSPDYASGSNAANNSFQVTLNANKPGFLSDIALSRSGGAGDNINYEINITQGSNLRLNIQVDFISNFGSVAYGLLGVSGASYASFIQPGEFNLSFERLSGAGNIIRIDTPVSFAGTNFSYTSQRMNARDTDDFFLNFTVIVGADPLDNAVWIRPITQDIIWNVQACDSSSICGFSPANRSLFIDDVFPEINVEFPTGVLDYNFVGGNETLNVTFTDLGLDTCWFDYNGTNTTIAGCQSGVKNSTNFTLEQNNFNMTIYVNDTFGNFNSTFISWAYKILETNRTFNPSTFETESATFTINVSANSSLTDIGFVYDSVLTATPFPNNFSTITFDIPTSSGAKEFLWNFTYSGETISSASSTQTVTSIQFDFCNATLTDPYINFTFKNETTDEESITATINSVWNIWIGSGNTRKTFTLINGTENPSYGICFSPPNKTINTNVTLTYNNNISQQRAFTSEPLLTNSTTNQVLYLLPSVLGLFTQFQTIDTVNNPISAVKAVITRTLGSSIVTSSSFFTDSSGLVVFFLNPDVVYTATFSKTGFSNNIFTFVPTTDLRFVTMGSGQVVNGSNISIGTNYQITPTGSSLTNDTLTTFGFNVTGSSGIDFISMNISDGNGTSFGFNSNAGTGFISLIINTSRNKTITGVFQIRTGEENLTFSKIWTIGNEFEGDYSINRQGKLFLEYEFSDFIRLVLVILTIFGVVLFMSTNELADNGESKIAATILLIWAFSSIGWLNNPAVVSNTGLAQYARQYGIAILSTGATVFFFIRRLFV